VKEKEIEQLSIRYQNPVL